MPDFAEWKKMTMARIDAEDGGILYAKAKIASAVGVSARTLDRWLAGTSKPSKDNVEALERYDPSLGPALREAFPDFYVTMEEEVRSLTAPFYSRVMEALEYLPKEDCFRPVTQLVIDLLVNHLDANTLPESESGFMAMMGQLQALPGEQNASSLHMHGWSAQGTGIWFEGPVKRSYAVGATSLSALAVAQGGIAVHPRDFQILPPVPIVHFDRIKSAAAYPLRYAARFAGVIYMASTERNYFTRYRREVVMYYARMLSLVFREQDFYDSAQIDFDVPTNDAAHLYLERLAVTHAGMPLEELIEIAVKDIRNTV